MDWQRSTPPPYFLIPFHLFLCHSICSHLTLTSISPSPLSSIAALFHGFALFSSTSFSSSLNGNRGPETAHLKVMELWQADPTALSPGRTAVPGLCDAYLPKHTFTQKWLEYTHLHTCTHTFIKLPRDHTCAHLHSPTARVFVCVWFYI